MAVVGDDGVDVDVATSVCDYGVCDPFGVFGSVFIDIYIGVCVYIRYGAGARRKSRGVWVGFGNIWVELYVGANYWYVRANNDRLQQDDVEFCLDSPSKR